MEIFGLRTIEQAYIDSNICALNDIPLHTSLGLGLEFNVLMPLRTAFVSRYYSYNH